MLSSIPNWVQSNPALTPYQNQYTPDEWKILEQEGLSRISDDSRLCSILSSIHFMRLMNPKWSLQRAAQYFLRNKNQPATNSSIVAKALEQRAEESPADLPKPTDKECNLSQAVQTPEKQTESICVAAANSPKPSDTELLAQNGIYSRVPRKESSYPLQTKRALGGVCTIS